MRCWVGVCCKDTETFTFLAAQTHTAYRWEYLLQALTFLHRFPAQGGGEYCVSFWMVKGGRGRGAVRTLKDLTLCLKWPVFVSGRKCFSF